MIKSKITHNLINVPGWKTSRKIVVFESDDWGTIRMSSKEAYNNLLKKGLPVDECSYSKNDSLESNDDLKCLFEVLTSVKDSKGNPAVITANNIVANPDFEKIRQSDFSQYFYEPFTETIKRYPEHDQVIDMYKEGITKGIFIPQFHGREHVNIERWLKALQQGDTNIQMAFEHSMFAVQAKKTNTTTNRLLAAMDVDSLQSIEKIEIAIADGLKLFEVIWGFKSKSFIAPCYVWSSALESTLWASGIRYIQGMVNQLEPNGVENGKYKKRYHYQGQKNKLGQRFLVRNAFFEPSYNKHFDWQADCLKRIEIAFRWKKPAIISTHRVNFMGYLRPENRETNLLLFKRMLNTIVSTWPDVEFMSSDQLGLLIESQNSS